ncbi:Uncharacterised protein [Mycobacteroides abscessus]|nr:Uncharacterised protein [Mycobacteroides abscessus]SIK01030.1 Uncharacterised protein [Mycobacteroides abscessus subsp. abscessus]
MYCPKKSWLKRVPLRYPCIDVTSMPMTTTETLKVLRLPGTWRMASGKNQPRLA